jgi:molybdopterin-guanine dinucleotide biosynthesis protein B
VPKLEVYREANGKPLLHPEDPHIVAIAADVPLATKLPRFALDEYDRIADFILARSELKR